MPAAPVRISFTTTYFGFKALTLFHDMREHCVDMGRVCSGGSLRSRSSVPQIFYGSKNSTQEPYVLLCRVRSCAWGAGRLWARHLLNCQVLVHRDTVAGLESASHVYRRRYCLCLIGFNLMQIIPLVVEKQNNKQQVGNTCCSVISLLLTPFPCEKKQLNIPGSTFCPFYAIEGVLSQIPPWLAQCRPVSIQND